MRPRELLFPPALRDQPLREIQPLLSIDQLVLDAVDLVSQIGDLGPLVHIPFPDPPLDPPCQRDANRPLHELYEAPDRGADNHDPGEHTEQGDESFWIHWTTP